MTANVNECVVKGKLIFTRKHEAKHYSHVLIPALDQWTSPGIVEIRSANPIGVNNQAVELPCRIGGYKRKPFSYTDADGVVTKVSPVDNTLDLIEA